MATKLTMGKVITGYGLALLLAFAAFLLAMHCGCSTVATQSADGKTLTMNAGFMRSASAEFENGARIQSQGWQPDVVSIEAPINLTPQISPDVMQGIVAP
jgi:hypothetical protein